MFEEVKPTVYGLAMDVVFDEEGRLRVIEIQNTLQSNNRDALELTGIDPKSHLFSQLTAFLPERPITTLCASVERAARVSPDMREEVVVLDGGIQALLTAKALFYHYCLQSPVLTPYLPPTQLHTVTSLSAKRVQGISALSATRGVLFKPVASSCGKGIALLPPLTSLSFARTVFHKSLLDFSRLHGVDDTVGDEFVVFVVQQNLGESLPVIRLYAAVRVCPDTESTKRFQIALNTDAAVAYRRVRPVSEGYTLGKFSPQRYRVTESQKRQLKRFVFDFVSEVDRRHPRRYPAWQQQADEYLALPWDQSAKDLPSALLFFINFFTLERDSNAGLLSFYQYALLHAVIVKMCVLMKAKDADFVWMLLGGLIVGCRAEADAHAKNPYHVVWDVFAVLHRLVHHLLARLPPESDEWIALQERVYHVPSRKAEVKGYFSEKFTGAMFFSPQARPSECDYLAEAGRKAWSQVYRSSRDGVVAYLHRR